eukprot:8009824-Heterocapsa_arctica.AAC.1
MSNKSKNGVDIGGICGPDKIGERPKTSFHNYKQWKHKRRKGHMDPRCWRKTRNNHIQYSQTTHSGNKVDGPILGIPKSHTTR